MDTSDSADYRISNKVWKERAKYMLDTGLFADVKITVRDSNKGVKIFEAHSLYLKWASPVFQRMLEGNFKESSYVIEFENCPEAFEALMTFIYTDRVVIKSSKAAWDLYDLAHQYDITRLDVLCTDYIEKNLNAQTVWLALDRSKIYSLERIQDSSHNFIETETTKVLTSSDFVDLEESQISFLLDQTVLNIPEAILFNSVEMWINAEIKRTGGNEEQQEETKTLLIKRFIPKIHFFEMTHNEFLDGPNKSDLLTMEQKLSLLTNFQNINSQDQLNLVEGLSLFPNKRNCGPKKCNCKSPGFFCYMAHQPPYSAEFKTDSSVLSTSIKINQKQDVLSFYLKTTSPNCFIISFSFGDNYYICIGAESGKLQLKIVDGGAETCKITSYECIDDGNMHSIMFIFRPPTVDMILDNYIKSRKFNYPRSYTERVLVIGKNDYVVRDLFKNGFSGCITSIFISSLGRMVDFHNDHREIWNVKPCKCEFNRDVSTGGKGFLPGASRPSS